VPDLRIHGDGLAALLLAEKLVHAGVSVHAPGLGPPKERYSGWGTEEPARRLLRSLGEAGAGLLRWSQRSLDLLSTEGLRSAGGLRWCVPKEEAEEEQRALSLLGLDAIALPAPVASRCAFDLPFAGALNRPALAARWAALHPLLDHDEGPAELEVQADPGHLPAGWLADKLHPIRHTELEAGPWAELWCQDDGWLGGGPGWTWGARWASPHLEEGELSEEVHPRVQAALERIAGVGASRARLTWHSCDRLPLIGPQPGAPRQLLLTGLGTFPGAWAAGAALHLAQGILGQPQEELPTLLLPARFT
jgi:hypothetical protein